MFKVGDYIQGTKASDSRYAITNSQMTKGLVTFVDGNDIKVRILEHKSGLGGITEFPVSASYFALYGTTDAEAIKEKLDKIRSSSVIQYMEDNFEQTKQGYIVYKTFGENYAPPKHWKIKKNSIIEETPNFDRHQDCGAGINVGTLSWVKGHNYSAKPIWKCLIKYEWLAGVVIPHGTDGKIRCERVKLLEEI